MPVENQKPSSRYSLALWFTAKLTLLCFLLGSMISPELNAKQNFVSYRFSGGRFGDNLMAYLHAKWLSYKYQLPLLYKPFAYSSELLIDEREIHYSRIDRHRCKKVRLEEIDESTITSFSRKEAKIYVAPYFPECRWEREHFLGPGSKPWKCFDVDWDDPLFRKSIRPLIAPNHFLQLLIPPKETINIAIHLRNGGTYDKEDTLWKLITKFPPLDFYVKGLLSIIELLPKKPFYCYLFTDAEDPYALISQIQSFMPQDVSITFDCRLSDNSHNQNVLEDFFSLFQFDILIHPQSNFSLIPALIHDYAITYAPLSGFRKEGIAEIDKIKFTINEPLLEELRHK